MRSGWSSAKPSSIRLIGSNLKFAHHILESISVYLYQDQTHYWHLQYRFDSELKSGGKFCVTASGEQDACSPTLEAPYSRL